MPKQLPKRAVLSIPFEVSMKSTEAGTIIWLLPDKLSRELEALPTAKQEEVRQIIRQRMVHLILIFIGLLQHPSLERNFGRELDLALGELVDRMADLLERPTVVH